jgi:hypothetical protein
MEISFSGDLPMLSSDAVSGISRMVASGNRMLSFDVASAEGAITATRRLPS